MRADARPRMQALQVWLGIPRSRALISWALCAVPGLSEDDELFLDFSAEVGADWLPIARKEGFLGQTQTCYPDAAGV